MRPGHVTALRNAKIVTWVGGWDDHFLFFMASDEYFTYLIGRVIRGSRTATDYNLQTL
jgi:hypothetical protein